jgi:alpha-glucoside transport system substrate-binding protein
VRAVVAGVAAFAVLAAAGYAAYQVGPGSGDRGCAAYARYGKSSGRSVSVLSGLPAEEAARHRKSYEQFTRCTGIAIEYEGANDLGTALATRIKGGKAPDLAYLSRPGLLAALAEQGAVREVPKAVADLVDQNWTAEWKRYGTVGGRFYATPLGADVSSLVWYSPKYVRGNELAIPATWRAMIAMSDTIASRGIKPWCEGPAPIADDGSGSRSAPNRSGTRWIEDAVLRTSGVDTYDQWVNHRIPFDDPRVQAAFDTAGTVLKNQAYVNGEDAGQPILKGLCALHRGTSSEAARWDPTLKISAGGDVFAFYLPPIDPTKGKPVLGTGEFAVAFDAEPEVVAFQTYLASKEWANTKAELGGWASANKGLDVDHVPDPIQRLAVRLLQDPKATFRLEGAELMPAVVGDGSFPKGVNTWIDGQDTAQVTSTIEASWPKR